MKRYKLFALMGALIFSFVSCETEVEDPAGDRGVASVPGVLNMNPATFDLYDLENTYVQFELALDDPAVEDVIIVASFEGDRRRTEIMRVNSFPSTVVIELNEVASILGISLESIEAADVFNFEVQTIQDGRT